MLFTSIRFDEDSIYKSSPSSLALVWNQLRPKQWSKNLLLFAALIFSINKVDFMQIAYSIIGFLIFCVISSTVYIINDFVDRDADRAHPVKRHRPMASGRLNPVVALSVGTVLFLLSLLISFLLNPLFMVIAITYFVINVSYSLYLKHIVILDLMLIASGFVLRAIAGGVIISVSLTPWFLLCTLLLSLFLAIGKRRHELILLQDGVSAHRKVLESYSVSLLDQFSNIVTAATVLSYSLFTFTSSHTVYLMLTIPFVIYGMFRYLYLIQIRNLGGSPEHILLEDKPILITVVMYSLCVVIILLLKDSGYIQ
ncbi:decaprenyl-phosphate phosphoribosyltransferase [Paenibacillus sp. JSM ZJ436]|uniref:decaprenyl-phosphate phosphoribosyltransferase n=1 Tax=Paenibacillus sp. JSM ZJ436 TaxID=3376190 RepID=UPI0037A3A511